MIALSGMIKIDFAYNLPEAEKGQVNRGLWRAR